MLLNLRRTVQYHSTLTKLNSYLFTDEKYTKNVEMHRAVIVTRIIKLILKNPYKSKQKP
jgi:hypothetical protein